MVHENSATDNNEQESKPVLKVLIHSFVVIPFLIAVLGVLFFTFINLLTREEHSPLDYLNDIKVGGANRRWQAAYELSQILNKPNSLTENQQFVSEMINLFRQVEHDDVRVRQYLALAMGRTGNPSFLDPLVEVLPNAREDNLPAIINALGNLRQAKAATALYSFLNHANPSVRLQTVIALGRLADKGSLEVLRKSLYDREPNVRWDAAVALAKMGDVSGNEVLLSLLNESYLEDFKEVDVSERDQAMLVAIKAAEMLNDPLLDEAIEKLSKTARNMEVRKIALRVISMRQENTKQ
jgi:HEAT repeat protein